MRLIKLFRLIKLLKVLGASRLVERWQAFVGLSYAEMTMIKFALMTVFLVHFMACIWSQTAIGWEYVPEDGDRESDTTWIEAGNYSSYVGHRPMRIYTIAFYTSVVAMFGGVGSIVPHNHTEFVVLTCMMIFGSFVWAWVIGSLCGILATLDPQATAFRNTMDELNHFMAESNFPTAHKVRVREFFRQRKDFDRVEAYKTLLSKMSSQLKGDSALLLSIETLEPVWYLHDDHCEKEFLAVRPHAHTPCHRVIARTLSKPRRSSPNYAQVTALHMHHVVYESQEQVPVHDLTVLIKGMISQRLKITTKGGVFGEDCIIPERFSGLRTDQYVSCISFVMVVVISRETLFELAENFPHAKKWLNRCSKRLTIRAAFRKAYAIYREDHKLKTKPSALQKRPNGPAAAPSKRWRKALARLKAARRHIDLELKKPELGSCNDILATREHSAFTENGGTIFAEVMYQQRRSNPLPNQSPPNPPAPTRPRYKKNKEAESPMIQRVSVSPDTEDTLRNAKELRHAMSTLELQQLSLENKVQTMLEMLTKVWGAG